MLHWVRAFLALLLVTFFTGCAGMDGTRMPRFNTVVVDPGHGGKDDGGRGNGIREKNFTLDLSERLAAQLRDRGFRVVLTRTEDCYLRLSERVSIGEKQRSALFVSIHANMGRRRERGFITFKSTDPRTISVARRVQTAATNVPGTVSGGIARQDFWVLVQNRQPALLLECGFMTNRDDARLLAGAEYRQQLAAAIAKGIAEERAGL